MNLATIKNVQSITAITSLPVIAKTNFIDNSHCAISENDYKNYSHSIRNSNGLMVNFGLKPISKEENGLNTISKEKKARIIDLCKKGFTVAEIAERVECSKDMVFKVLLEEPKN